MLSGLLAISTTLLLCTAAANECTDQCDIDNGGSGIPAEFCGTDFEHYKTYSGVFKDDCYAECGVMVQYEGSCGCPNDCYSSMGRGACDLNQSLCICVNGFDGPDCSLPSAGNICSLHGMIVPSGNMGSLFPFDYCECDAGWTGTDCSSVIFQAGDSHPWKTIFGSSKDVYTSHDEYGDEHPIFNISVLATIRVELNPADLLHLLQPWNLYNESYAPATMHFDNGIVRETVEGVAFRVKGATSRLLNKKGWNIKFDEFDEAGSFYGMSKFGLKVRALY